MSNPMIIPHSYDVAVIIGIGPRADPFGLFSPITRNFGYRVLSIYTFLNCSHHSASNDMQQPYVLTNRLGNSIPFWFDDVIITYMSYCTTFRQQSRGVCRLNFFYMVMRTSKQCQTFLCFEWSRNVSI